MRVTPLSEKEADDQSANLWPDGEYDFEVKEASEETSNAGNDMFKLELWIYNQEGGRRIVFDYLVSSEKSAWKIRHFAASCGLLPQYEAGQLIESEIVGRTGRCAIATQPAKDNYPAKNVVRGYVKAAATSRASVPSSRAKAPAGDIDDDIPF